MTLRLTAALALAAVVASAAAAAGAAAVKPPVVKPPTPPVIRLPSPPTPPTPPLVRPPTPPVKAKATAPSPRVFAVLTATTLEFHATGLVPGTVYEAVYEIHGDGRPGPYFLFVSGPSVKPDGTFTVADVLLADIRDAVAPYPPSKVVMYLRPVFAPTGTVSTYPDGEPILTTFVFG